MDLNYLQNKLFHEYKIIESSPELAQFQTDIATLTNTQDECADSIKSKISAEIKQKLIDLYVT